ncbi:hypothetical protein HU200_030904 [Digitaria exilis]|uniref:Retrotransposon gag domain-containing protein n=1 Tax=Digitaria exilis TaxID=1010633 RepID=A0A835BR49_9POAL|nr:hypothetical protein HU200_030904 [Digitaria exilis]
MKDAPGWLYELPIHSGRHHRPPSLSKRARRLASSSPPPPPLNLHQASQRLRRAKQQPEDVEYAAQMSTAQDSRSTSSGEAWSATQAAQAYDLRRQSSSLQTSEAQRLQAAPRSPEKRTPVTTGTATLTSAGESPGSAGNEKSNCSRNWHQQITPAEHFPTRCSWTQGNMPRSGDDPGIGLGMSPKPLPQIQGAPGGARTMAVVVRAVRIIPSERLRAAAAAARLAIDLERDSRGPSCAWFLGLVAPRALGSTREEFGPAGAPPAGARSPAIADTCRCPLTPLQQHFSLPIANTCRCPLTVLQAGPTWDPLIVNAGPTWDPRIVQAGPTWDPRIVQPPLRASGCARHQTNAFDLRREEQPNRPAAPGRGEKRIRPLSPFYTIQEGGCGSLGHKRDAISKPRTAHVFFPQQTMAAMLDLLPIHPSDNRTPPSGRRPPPPPPTPPGHHHHHCAPKVSSPIREETNPWWPPCPQRGCRRRHPRRSGLRYRFSVTPVTWRTPWLVGAAGIAISLPRVRQSRAPPVPSVIPSPPSFLPSHRPQLRLPDQVSRLLIRASGVLATSGGAVLVDAAFLDAVPLLRCEDATGIRVDHADVAGGHRKIFSIDVANHAVWLLIDVLHLVSTADQYVRAGLWLGPAKARHRYETLAPIPLEVNNHPRAGSFRLARGSAASRTTPTLEGVSSLELAIQARARLDGNNAQRAAIHQSHHDAVKKQGSLLYAISHSPEKTSVKSTRNTTLEGSLEGDHGKPCARHHLDAVSCHEKEGRYRSWKARFPLAYCAAWTNSAHNDKHMYSHPAPLVYKREREAHAKGKTRRDHKSHEHSHLALAGTRIKPLLSLSPSGKRVVSTAITRRCRCDQIRHRHAALLPFPMANSGERRPPLDESDLLPAGQEIRFGSLRFQTCGDDYHTRVLQEDPSNQPEPHHQPPAAPRRRSPRAARRAADVGNPRPTREGDVLQSGSQGRAAPFLPGPMSAPRATTVHSYPYGLRNSADAYASSIRTTMSVYGDQPGCHPVSEQDFADPLPGDSCTESEDGHAFMRRHPGWDYSGLRDPEAFIAFQTAADYCFGYSDDEYDPTKECFVINDGQLSEGSTSDDDGGGDDQGNDDGIDPIGAQPSDPSDHSPSEDERDPRHLPRASGDVSPPARSDHEPAKQGDEHGTDARHAGRVAQARILAEGKDDELAPRTSQKLIAAAALLRAMPEAATPEGRKLHLEAQKLVENAARQQAESSASRLRRSSASKGERGGESLVRSPRPNGRARAQSRGDYHRDMARHHVGEPRAPEAGTLPARVPAISRLRDTRGAINGGDARNTLNQIRQREGARTHQRGRTDVGWNRDAVSEPAGTRVFSRNIRTAPIPPRFRPPTTITKYSGETDPRVWLNDYRLACQLGGATDDDMIVRNLPLHLADSARTWLEHLPPNRIHDWNDLVETFVRNFQGTYVHPRNMWDLRGCNQKPGESLRDFIRRFSKRCTELPNITDHQIIHSFLENTTCYSLVCKLGRDPPPDANRLFEVASKYASGEEAANAIFNGKKGKRPEETPAKGSKPRKPSRKQQRRTKSPQWTPATRGLEAFHVEETWDNLPPTEILANACDIQQLSCVKRTKAGSPEPSARLRLEAMAAPHFPPPKFSGSAPAIKVVPAATIFARERTPFRRHATPEKARTLPHEVAVTALTVIMTPHEEVEGTFNTPTLERAAFVLLIRGSNSGPPKGFDRGPRSTESGIIESEPRSSNTKGPLEGEHRALDPYRMSLPSSNGAWTSARTTRYQLTQASVARSQSWEAWIASSSYCGRTHMTAFLPTSATRLPPLPRAERNTWSERSRLPPRREEVIVLLIRGSNLGSSKGFDKGPRSTGSGIIDATLESEPRSSNPRLRDPSRGSIEPSTSIERDRVPSSMLLRKAFTGVSYDHEPTLIERGMDLNQASVARPHLGKHGSPPPQHPRTGSPRYEENSKSPLPQAHSKRSALQVETLRECQPLSQGLGGYTRGCASVPPRILGIYEDMKASKASTSTNLRRTEFHSRGGSGATVGYLQKGYPNLSPKRPSKGPPSLRDLGTHLARVSVSLEAQQPRGRPPPSRGCLPSRSRVGELELAIQARARLDGNNAQRAAIHQSHHDAVKKQGSLLYAISHSPEKTSVKSTRNTTLEGSLEGDHGKPCARHHLDAVSCHEKEGRYVSPCHAVSGVGRRDSRLRTARHGRTVHTTTNTCTRTPPPWSIKGRGKPMQRARHAEITSLTNTLTLLVNPYYKQHVIRCIAPLLDVRPSGRNQDKTPSFTLAIRETSG